jgi:uncharacterized repeat protein (TIGR03803 family)
MRKALFALLSLLPVLLLSAVTPTAWAATQKTLHSFAGGSDGAYPGGTLLLDSHGNLFGVTNSGGNDECDSSLSAGCGTVFELLPNGDSTWSESVLHVFSQSTDGGQPLASPVMDATGNIYGSTQYYGPNAEGVLWQLTPSSGGPWNENIIHTYHGVNDGYWCAGLGFDPHGRLFGTTFGGGASNDGTVFELIAQSAGSWSDRVLHNFAGGANDGNAPDNAPTFDAHGNIYSTTYEGGPHLSGTVFEMKHTSSGWTEKPIYFFQGLAFGGGADGANPVAGVVFDPAGNLYGTTDYGGEKSVGTVYELSPNGSGGWTEKVLYTFTDGADGGHPGGLIIDAAGNLYGVTSGHDTFGSVFELSPNGGSWTFTVLYDFQGGADGGSPSGSLVRDADGNLYGTASYGGANGQGTVFEITP